MNLIQKVISVVVFLAAVPALWTILDGSLTDITTASIPLLSSMTGVIGILFGALCIGGVVAYFKLKNR